MLSKYVKFLDSHNKVIEKIFLFFCGLYMFTFPILSNYSNKIILLICNILEYAVFVFLILVFPKLYSICQKSKLHKSIFILSFIFCLYVLLMFFFNSNYSLNNFITNSKMILGFFFFLTYITIINSKKKTNIFLIIFISSMYTLFLYTLITTPLDKIKQAFTGGLYRFGNQENQANAYANYCSFCVLSSIFLCKLNKKNIFYLLSIIPAIMCIGTQSKKGILIIALMLIYILYSIYKKINNKALKIIYPASLLIGVVGILAFAIHLGAFDRVLETLSGSSESTFSRIWMFKVLFIEIKNSPLFGFGTNTFQNFMFSYTGYYLVLHSTWGDALFSLGLIGFMLWTLFIYKVIINDSKCNYFLMAVVLIMQIMLDSTAQIWFQPINFIFLAIYRNLMTTNFYDNKLGLIDGDFFGGVNYYERTFI